MAIEKTIIVNVDTGNSEKGVEKLNVVDSAETNKDAKRYVKKFKPIKLPKKLNGIATRREHLTKFKGLTSAVKVAVTGFKSLIVANAAKGLGIGLAYRVSFY